MVCYINLGQHIGTFGDLEWVLGDSSRYCPLPFALQHDNEEVIKKTELAQRISLEMKKDIYDRWKALIPDSSSGAIDEFDDVRKFSKRQRTKKIQVINILLSKRLL